MNSFWRPLLILILSPIAIVLMIVMLASFPIAYVVSRLLGGKAAEMFEGWELGDVLKMTAASVGVWLLIWVVVLVVIGQGVQESPQTGALDQKAYEEIRRRGYSPEEARQMAPSVRRLCEQTGGDDCS